MQWKKIRWHKLIHMIKKTDYKRYKQIITKYCVNNCSIGIQITHNNMLQTFFSVILRYETIASNLEHSENW